MVWQAIWQQVYVYGKESVRENLYTAIACVVLVLGFGTYWSYQWWQRSAAMDAQLAYVESYEAYQRALTLPATSRPEVTKEAWAQAAADFEQAYERHKHSSYAPYARAFKAQVALQQGERAVGIAGLRAAIGMMGRSDPYRGLYQTSLALALLDGAESEVNEGLQQLEAAARDTHNNYQDMALYYLGLWYGAQGQSDRAAGYWQQIAPLSNVAEREEARSPWLPLISR